MNMELTMSAWNGTFEEWEDTRPATDAEVLAAAATLPGAKVVEWCEAHDSNWLDAPPIHRGCGWANELKPCVKAPGSRVLIPLSDKET